MAESVEADTQSPYGKLPLFARDFKNPVRHEISALEEMRVEIDKAPLLHIWMSKGQAEIYGSELSTDRIYTFLKGTKISIWSWTGCSLLIEGKPDSVYKTKESRVMTMHFNLHNCLEQYRDKARREDAVGPRVLIVGAVNTGRSVLSKILLNYAARMRGDDKRNPIFVDLDFIQPDLAVPGTLACCQFDRPADPMFDYYYHRKFVLPYGYTDFDSNPELLHSQIQRLGTVIEKKFQKDSRAKHSGLIINSFAWTKQHNYTHIFVIAKAFKVNFIVVLDNERMFNELQKTQPDEHELEGDLQVISMPRARGLVESTPDERRSHREMRIRYNIFGHPLRLQQQPYEHEVDLNEISLCKLGNPHVNKALLPANVDLVKVKTAAYPLPTKELISTYNKHHIYYITNVDAPEKVISEGSVIGYLLVKNIEMPTKKITFLSNFEVLPKKVFLASMVQLRD